MKKHVFVCLQNRPLGDPRGSCQARGGTALYEAFAQAIAERGAAEFARLTHAGCLGPCTAGPSVVVYPEGVLYSGLAEGDVPEIVEQHLLGGVPVSRLVREGW